MYVDKDGSPLGKLSEKLAVLPVRKARRKELSALVDRAVKLEAENEVRKDWQDKAVDRLITWLKCKDDIDFIVHVDRLLRELCNCENELPPCRICTILAKDKDGWVLDENQQWRKVEKGKYV